MSLYTSDIRASGSGRKSRLSYTVNEEKLRMLQCPPPPLITKPRPIPLKKEVGDVEWRAWGPYLSDRAWGTVREDYSRYGSAWDSFPFDHAISRAYRWSEDGIGGICDQQQRLCVAPAFWNGEDEILKERLFGLNNSEGNHGEDVKECYYYVDNTPSHSYMKMVYRYPQTRFPYDLLRERNRHLSRDQPEFELVDALREDLANGRYFNIDIEYCKVDSHDILSRITAVNMSKEKRVLHLIEQVWFRNTWSWPSEEDVLSEYPVNDDEGRRSSYDCFRVRSKPKITKIDEASIVCVNSDSEQIAGRERMYVYFAGEGQQPPRDLLFTENETNVFKVYGGEYFPELEGTNSYFKDGINCAVVMNEWDKVNPNGEGTKVGAYFVSEIEPLQRYVVYLRLTDKKQESARTALSGADAIFQRNISEADRYYEALHNPLLDDDERCIQRQALAGLLWSKQFYHYSLGLWYGNDMSNKLLNPHQLKRHNQRNRLWRPHLNNAHIICMPDKWEYPWYAVWDTAFHVIPLAMVDMDFAKQQILLFISEDYMHPNGQIPAYEWNFDDVNPPVHAWATWRLYCIDRSRKNVGDVDFLERAYHKLLLNFTWWINRKDLEGNNVFEGGFLGMDNIGVFDRSQSLPTGGNLEQADGTAWMAMYCLNMLAITLELAVHRKNTYEDMAIKFFDHFVLIASTMGSLYNDGEGLWDEEDGFFYDILRLPDNQRIPLKVRSFVGLIPLFAVETIEQEWLTVLPRFKERLLWYMQHRRSMIKNIAPLDKRGENKRRLLSVVSEEKLVRILSYVLDEENFLGEFGLRTLSKFHADRPYTFNVQGTTYKVAYEPAESTSVMFGGNSNWRGPIWFPVNFLMLESLQKFHRFYGDKLKVEMPTGSKEMMSLEKVTVLLSRRLCKLFTKKSDGSRPVFGDDPIFKTPEWSQYVLFYEYFHGETGRGLGASHQTGWTGLVAKLLQQCGGNMTKYRAKSVFLYPPQMFD